ncbi:MAG: chromosomal replication initiator protein DnaA, partial [Clostridiales bacterium]|nr:chromosomal replication initiator protein DnaA [Clostridiales bacterium]
LNYICENVTSNIRQLNGAYNILSSYFALSNEVVDLPAAEKMLGSFISPKKAQQISPELVISMVSQFYGVNVEKMKSKVRSKEVITARNVAMYILRELFDITLDEIGKTYFDGKNYSTIIHSINKVNTDENLLKDVEDIKKRITNEGYQL